MKFTVRVYSHIKLNFKGNVVEQFRVCFGQATRQGYAKPLGYIWEFFSLPWGQGVGGGQGLREEGEGVNDILEFALQ